MALAKNLTQWKRSFAVPREAFIRAIVENEEMTKKQLRVTLLLLASLDGYSPPKSSMRGDENDPMLFTAISKKEIANTLNIDKTDVDDAIDFLLSYEILEEGKDRTNKKGYRFTF